MDGESRCVCTPGFVFVFILLVASSGHAPAHPFYRFTASSGVQYKVKMPYYSIHCTQYTVVRVKVYHEK